MKPWASSLVITTSRGAVPHLTPDLALLSLPQTGARFHAYLGLEDLYYSLLLDYKCANVDYNSVERLPNLPAITKYPGPIQRFICLPEEATVILGPRRPIPFPIAEGCDDALWVNSIEGRRLLPTELSLQVARKCLRPQDIFVSMADMVSSPGSKRKVKIFERSLRWLRETIDAQV